MVIVVQQQSIAEPAVNLALVLVQVQLHLVQSVVDLILVGKCAPMVNAVHSINIVEKQTITVELDVKQLLGNVDQQQKRDVDHQMEIENVILDVVVNGDTVVHLLLTVLLDVKIHSVKRLAMSLLEEKRDVELILEEKCVLTTSAVLNTNIVVLQTITVDLDVNPPLENVELLLKSVVDLVMEIESVHLVVVVLLDIVVLLLLTVDLDAKVELVRSNVLVLDLLRGQSNLLQLPIV